MFCGKCGKEIADNVKFCPYCGSENQNAVKTASANSSTVRMQGISFGSLNLYQVILAVCGVLQIPFYFWISYGRLEGLSSALASAASYLGINIPQRLTAENGVKIWDDLARVGIENAAENHTIMLIIFMIPIVFGILLLVNSLWKKNTVISLVLSVLILISYLLIRICIPAYEQLGYGTGGNWIVALLVAAAGVAVSVLNYISSNSNKR